MRDGVVVGLLVLPIAALVALTSMVSGAIARVFDQRETLTSLRLAGTPLEELVAAQRREMILPTILLGAIALMLADRLVQPVLDGATADLSERE